MIVQRLCAAASLVIQAALLWFITGSPFFSALIIIGALAGVVLPQRISLSRNTAFWSLVALFFGFVLKYLLAPHEFHFASTFIGTTFAYVVGQFMMTVQVAQFFIRREDDRLPASMPAYGLFALICLGDIQANPLQMRVFQIGSLCFFVAATLFIASDRKFRRQVGEAYQWGRLSLILAALGLSLASGWLISTGLQRYERDIDDLIVRYLLPERIATTGGFSGNARLGSVAAAKNKNGRQIALRIYSDDAPGYLRGAAFDVYDRGTWQSRQIWRAVPQIQELPPGVSAAPGEYHAFLTKPTEANAWAQYEVWPASSQPPAAFAPLGTGLLQAPVQNVNSDRNDILETNQLLQGIPYHVAIPHDQPAPQLTEEDRIRLTEIPITLDVRIVSLAREVGGQLESTPEKLTAVEAYFAANYEYQIGITIPSGADPLNYFLLEKPAAHCEYFASGAVALLRSMGVPCRYVTGYVAAEKNDVGGYWVARNEHAHAWVEAYVEEIGWVTVEPTPAAGVPESEPAKKTDQMWEYFREAFMSLRIQLQQGYLRIVFRSLLKSPAFFVTLGLILLYILIRFRSIHMPTGREKKRATDPELRDLHRLLEKMDARMKKRELIRRPGETLSQFAHRITTGPETPPWQTAAADWYENYTQIRYRGPASAEAIQALKQQLREVV